MKNTQLKDGSILFDFIDKRYSRSYVIKRLRTSGRIVVDDLLNDLVNPLWINFSYDNKKFSINENDEEYLVICHESKCEKNILTEVSALFSDAKIEDEKSKNIPIDSRFYYFPLASFLSFLVSGIIFLLMAGAFIWGPEMESLLTKNNIVLVIFSLFLLSISIVNLVNIKKEWKIVSFDDELKIEWPFRRKIRYFPLSCVRNFEIQNEIKKWNDGKLRIFVLDYHKILLLSLVVDGVPYKVKLATYFFGGRYYKEKIAKIEKYIYQSRKIF
jgi:hypothetical protein